MIVVKSYQKSQELLKRALNVTPLGAQTYSKCYRYFGEESAPAFLERGQGCYVWDVDGNQYIDFVCSLGPVTVGYNDSRVNKAIVDQLNKGISFSLSHPLEIELAEKIVDIIPCAEMVRFVKNGSDATTAAIKLARAYTGRDMVLVCGYHGMHDWYIGSTANRAGVPDEVQHLTKSFEYNRIESLQKLFSQYEDKVGAVILEPIQGNGPEEHFLQEVKELTHQHGALLIFDEVVSGFRYALGGAQELYGVSPDLVSFGKGIANGMPLSAVAGKKEVLEMIGSKNVFISTTFGGETLSLAAALATIKILEQPGVYQQFWHLGNLMLDGLKQLIEKYNLSHVLSVYGLAPHGGVSFEGSGSLDYLDINSVWQQRFIQEGIISAAINNLNVSHTEHEIKRYLEVSESAMDDIQRVLAQDSLKGILKGEKLNPVFKRNK